MGFVEEERLVCWLLKNAPYIPGKIPPWFSFPPLTPSTAVQSVTLGTEFGLSTGTFMLSLHHRNATANTTQARNKQQQKNAITELDLCLLGTGCIQQRN